MREFSLKQKVSTRKAKCSWRKTWKLCKHHYNYLLRVFLFFAGGKTHNNFSFNKISNPSQSENRKSHENIFECLFAAQVKDSNAKCYFLFFPRDTNEGGSIEQLWESHCRTRHRKTHPTKHNRIDGAFFFGFFLTRVFCCCVYSAFAIARVYIRKMCFLFVLIEPCPCVGIELESFTKLERKIWFMATVFQVSTILAVFRPTVRSWNILLV